MRIIFMGTPEIAQKSLKRLCDEGYGIAAVFTGNDKPRHRGMKVSPSPVKELALERGIPVYHPPDLTPETVSSLNPDLIATVAFGRLLHSGILRTPPLGCINIHASLLPKYRGAAPIQHAILNGELQTGVTSMYMSDEMDAGDIIFAENTPISDEETSVDLFRRVGDIGARLLVETIGAIGQGKAPRTPQNHSEATYAPKLTKEMSPIDFNASSHEIKCKVRALVPWPVATMILGGKTVKVYGVDATDKQSGEMPGTIISDARQSIEVACKSGTIIVNCLQAPGGKILSAPLYLRGNRVI